MTLPAWRPSRVHLAVAAAVLVALLAGWTALMRLEALTLGRSIGSPAMPVFVEGPGFPAAEDPAAVPVIAYCDESDAFPLPLPCGSEVLSKPRLSPVLARHASTGVKIIAHPVVTEADREVSEYQWTNGLRVPWRWDGTVEAVRAAARDDWFGQWRAIQADLAAAPPPVWQGTAAVRLWAVRRHTASQRAAFAGTIRLHTLGDSRAVVALAAPRTIVDVEVRGKRFRYRLNSESEAENARCADEILAAVMAWADTSGK